MKRKALIPSLTLALLLFSPSFAAHVPEVSEKMTGKPLPSFSMKTLEGNSYSDQSVKGPVLFNFFASWCPPCRKEMTALKELQAQYGKNITFIGVLIDPVETPDTVNEARAFLAKNPLPYPVLMMSAPVKENFKFEGIPTVYLVDKNKKFATTLFGPQPKQTIEKYIQKVVAAK